MQGTEPNDSRGQPRRYQDRYSAWNSTGTWSGPVAERVLHDPEQFVRIAKNDYLSFTTRMLDQGLITNATLTSLWGFFQRVLGLNVPNFFCISREYAQDQKKCFCRGPASLELDMSHKSILWKLFHFDSYNSILPCPSRCYSRRESVSVLAASR